MGVLLVALAVINSLTFWLSSHSVGMCSEAVKYIWIMNAVTDALLIAGAAQGPEQLQQWWGKLASSESYGILFKTFQNDVFYL